MWINARFHYFYANILNRMHYDKKCVELILQFNAIKPFQKKGAQREDIITRAPVKPQTMENLVENMMEIWHFVH